MQPQYNQSRLAIFFFAPFLLLGHYFLLNLVLAVVWHNFQLAEQDIQERAVLNVHKAGVIAEDDMEYEALGVPFADRGKRFDEQIEVLRALWTEDLVDFDGEYHRIDRANLLPRPKKPIPLWFGALSDVTVLESSLSSSASDSPVAVAAYCCLALLVAAVLAWHVAYARRAYTAAPCKPTSALSTTCTGISAASWPMRPFSKKFCMKRPSLIWSRSLGAMPPTMYNPCFGSVARAQLPATVP